MGVDQVDVEARTGVQVGRVGGEAFEEAGPPRPGSDDDELLPHRAFSVPRA